MPSLHLLKAECLNKWHPSDHQPVMPHLPSRFSFSPSLELPQLVMKSFAADVLSSDLKNLLYSFTNVYRNTVMHVLVTTSTFICTYTAAAGSVQDSRTSSRPHTSARCVKLVQGDSETSVRINLAKSLGRICARLRVRACE
jgi:hypothetical protein